MNKIISATVTTLLVLSIITALLYAAFRVFIWATAKDINKNLDIQIEQNLDKNVIKSFSNNTMTFNAETIAKMKDSQNQIYNRLIEESKQYDADINKKDKQKEKAKNRNLSSRVTSFVQSASYLNKKLTEEKSPIHQGLSALDFALDWAILDIAAKKVFLKVLKNQMNEILSDLAKIDKLNFKNDQERSQTTELFFRINARLATIKFALEVVNSRDMKEISSNRELKKSINDIHSNLIKSAMPYKMQMIDDKGNLIKEENGGILQDAVIFVCGEEKKEPQFLPKFQDPNSKPKDIEINKCLAIASTFEAVHELKGKFV